MGAALIGLMTRKKINQNSVNKWSLSITIEEPRVYLRKYTKLYFLTGIPHMQKHAFRKMK
jgi:hypothetical protein